jgi:surfeit locus 1 family protein
VEWWVFGAFALFVWVRWCRDSLEVLGTADQAAPDPEPAPEPQA